MRRERTPLDPVQGASVVETWTEGAKMPRNGADSSSRRLPNHSTGVII